MQLYVTYAAQAVKHLVDNLRLVSVATLPSCGSYAAALHLSRRPQANHPVATAAQRKQAAQRPRSRRESPFRGDGKNTKFIFMLVNTITKSASSSVITDLSVK